MANKRNILIMGTMTELIIRSGWTDINYLDYVFFIPFGIKKKGGKVVSDFRSKPSNGDTKLSNLRSKHSNGHTKLCVNTPDSLLRTYLKLSYYSYSTAVQIVTDYPIHSMSL